MGLGPKRGAEQGSGVWNGRHTGQGTLWLRPWKSHSTGPRQRSKSGAGEAVRSSGAMGARAVGAGGRRGRAAKVASGV